MSKTNPVMLNGVSVGADGAELRDGDEVVFPSAEAEHIVFRYALVLKETGAVLGVAKSIGSPISKNEVPKSPLGERNGARMAAKAATPDFTNYQKDTLKLVDEMYEVLALDIYDMQREKRISVLKKDGNTWSSRYAPGGSAKTASGRAFYNAINQVRVVLL